MRMRWMTAVFLFPTLAWANPPDQQVLVDLVASGVSRLCAAEPAAREQFLAAVAARIAPAAVSLDCQADASPSGMPQNARQEEPADNLIFRSGFK